MKSLLDQLNASIKSWRQKSPEAIGKFLEFMEAVEKPKALDTKTKELIAVALSVASHCQWCIAFHVRNALKAGANEEEIREAAWVAVVMGGGPSLSYMQLVEEALKDFQEK
ncbi:MAG: carboxymuconolactone decarboxylase family protein [Deltaproteobacteria bacterium]|nr:MAG: carboxymuconolactone decarboxylase family protein [Deltaproteobacteria bacterium]